MHKSERKFADYLIANNKTYVSQPPRFKLKNTTYRVDFYCPEDNIYYEVIGTKQALFINKKKIIELLRLYPEINFKLVKPTGKNYILNDNNLELIQAIQEHLENKGG